MIGTKKLHGAIACALATLFWTGCGGDSFTATEGGAGHAGTSGAAGSAGQGGGTTSAGGTGGSTGGTTSAGGTGGSMGGTGGAPACQPLSDACAQCSYNAVDCQDRYCACYANQDCVVLIACLQACPLGDAACQQQCMSQPSAKDHISEAYLLGDCVAVPCMAECPGVTAAGPCEKCLFTDCPTEMNACLNDADCATILQCAIKCAPGDFNCALACTNGKPQASVNLALAVQACSADAMKCKTDCGM